MRVRAMMVLGICIVRRVNYRSVNQEAKKRGEEWIIQDEEKRKVIN